MPRHRTAACFLAALLALGVGGCSGVASPAAAPRPTVAPPVTTSAPSVPEGRAPDRDFGVGVRQFVVRRDGDRRLPVTLWYPAVGTAGSRPEPSVAVADGRFPVVVFSHGLDAEPEDYARLLSRWASAGLVVAAPTFPGTSRGAGQRSVLDVLNQPADVSAVLTEVLARGERAEDPLRGRLAVERVAAAGHSAGAVTTIGLFTAGRDERLDAGVVFAGTTLGVGSAYAGPAAPQLFVHGERDEVVEYAAGRAAYDAVPWPKAMLSLPRGDHGRALLTDGALYRVVADTTTEFLRWSLYGDQAANRRLTAAATRNGLANLDNRLHLRR